MSDIAFKKNPTNGLQGIEWDATNDATFDDTEQHAVMASLVAVRAKWWADTLGAFGSDLQEVKTIDRVTTKSAVEGYARQALDGLVKAGRIVIAKVLVDLPDLGLAGRISVAVYWSARGSAQQTARVFI